MKQLNLMVQDGESFENTAQRLADSIIAYTGDWLQEISCSGTDELIESNS
jgi:hypothetical protein